jgi:hypothetical protein
VEGNRRRGVRLAAAVAMIGGAVVVVAVFLPAFRVSGQGVDTTEKLFRDWEGKVGLVTGAVMILGGFLLWSTTARQSRLGLSALVSLAALVAIGSASYAIAVFRSQALDALAAQFGRLQGASADQVRPVLVAAVHSGALKLSGKIGVPILIIGASLAFFAGAYVLATLRLSSESPAGGSI